MEATGTVRPETLTRLGRSVGTDDFFAAGLAVLGELVARDMEWVVVYDRRGRPRTLRFALARQPNLDLDRDLILSTYEAGFYRFDPFFRYWRAGGAASVLGMHEFDPPADRADPYMADFLPLTRMADDVAVMLPAGPGQCVALTLERATRFTDAEFRRLRQVYPLLAGLAESHRRATVEAAARAPAAAPALDFAAAVNGFTVTGLTPRERDIVHLVLSGYASRTIAERLRIGLGTVRNHRKRLYAKLDITTERELFSLFLGYLADTEPGELS